MDWERWDKWIWRITLFAGSSIIVVYALKVCHILDFIMITIKALIPVLIGVFISFLLEPCINQLMRWGCPRKGACCIVYLSITLLLLLLVLNLIPVMLRQLDEFSTYLPEIKSFFNQFQSSELSEWLGSLHLEEQMSDLIERCCNGLFHSLSHLIDIFVQIGIGAGAALYLSFDFKKVRAYYYDLAPRAYRKEYREISKQIGHQTFMFLRSLLYDTFIFFALSTLLLWLFNFPYPLIFSAILALTNLIPYIGPYIGLVPLAITGFMISQTQGLIAIALAMALQSIESTFISPILLKNMIYLHPAAGIFGISFFGALFGIIGMIFSPLLMTILKILYEAIDFKKIWLEKRVQMVYNSDEIDEEDE